MTYIVGHPIKNPGDFYGRYEQIIRFYEIIGGTQTQSISILGLRRAGKTSFLKYISHPDVMARFLPNASQYIMVYIDMSYSKTPSEFYYRLLMRIKQELGNKVVTTNLWKPSPPAETTIYDVETWLCEFQEKRVVLLLDEFDHLRSQAFDQDFLTELRAMTSVLDYDLACVTASYWDLYQLGAHLGLPPTSPFYNIFYPTPLYISGLDAADSNALIRNPALQQGFTYTNSEVEAIEKLAGTLPFFLQAVADKWLTQRRQDGKVNEDRIREDLTSEMHPFFSQWWRTMSEIDRHLLAEAAQIETLHDITYHQVELAEAHRRLLAYGLLREVNGSLQINGDVFHHWLVQHALRIMQNYNGHILAGNGNGNGYQDSYENGSGQFSRAQLRRALTEYFDMEELRTLCFDLGVDFDELPGAGLQAKARDLVHYWEKRGQLEKLVQAIRYERGHVV
ncbi:MAG: hypothetical protein Kow0080_18340 [Candidatus Promineifilaceae bacterium]